MKKRLIPGVLAVLLLVVLCVPAAASEGGMSSEIFTTLEIIGENEYLVKIEEDLTERQIEALVDAVGASIYGQKVVETIEVEPHAECVHKFYTVGTPSIIHLQLSPTVCELWELRMFKCEYCGIEKTRKAMIGTHHPGEHP